MEGFSEGELRRQILNLLKDFKELKVWVKAHLMALDVYKATKSFPAEEIYGLTSQMRRAGASVPTNIAEGCGRGSDAELGRFMSISMGSASELEYLVLLSKDLNYFNELEYNDLSVKVTEIKKMLASFIKKIKADG